MQVQRWDPLAVLTRVDREFDEIMRRNLSGAQVRKTSFIPAIELQRDGADALITLEVPGVDVSRDVSIEIERGKLVISGERRDERGEQQEGVLVRELRYGQFRREFSLPGHVTPEDVSAGYDAGLLQVRVAGVWQPDPEPVRVSIQPGVRLQSRQEVSLEAAQREEGTSGEHAAEHSEEQPTG